MFLVLVVTDELREFLVRARSGAAIRIIQVLIRDGECSRRRGVPDKGTKEGGGLTPVEMHSRGMSYRKQRLNGQ